MSEKTALAAMEAATVDKPKPAVTPAERLSLRMQHLVNRINHLTENPNQDPLRHIAIMKLLKQMADEEYAATLPLANVAYVAAKPAKGQLVSNFDVCLATFKAYTKPTKYEYPAPIVELEAELKSKKKAAEADGTAKPIKREFDPAKDQSFSVSVSPL